MKINAFQCYIPLQFSGSELELRSTGEVVQLLQTSAYGKQGKGIWIQRISKGFQSYFGIVCLTHTQDIVDRNILPHEEVLSRGISKLKEEIQTFATQLKPILLIYESSRELDVLLIRWMRKKDHQIKYIDSFGNLHQLWKIDDADVINEITHLLEKVKKVFLADGHHRTDIQAQLYQNGKNPRYEWIISAYFSFEKVAIYPYHRLIKSELSLNTLLKQLHKAFQVRELDQISYPGQGEILFSDGAQFFLLKWKQELLINPQADGDVDVSLFNSEVVQKIFLIEEERTNQDIWYIEGSKHLNEIRELLYQSEFRFAFIFNALPAAVFRSICEEGRTLPPKSTWFLPRMIAGLTVYKVD